MIPFYDCAPALRGAIGLWLLLLCLAFIYLAAMAVRQDRKPLPLAAAFLPCGAAVLLWIWLAPNFYALRHGGAPNAAGRLPLWALLLTLALLSAFAAAAAVVWAKRRRTRITGRSVKESLDRLPTGVCFYKATGKIYLANRRMDSLSQALTGRPLQNGTLLWSAVKSGSLAPGCEAVQTGESPIVRLPDESVFSFTRYRVPDGKKTMFEVNAADVTDVYRNLTDLKKKNEELERLNARLRDYGERAAETIREREILTAKADIHSAMNRLLLTTLHVLEDGGSEAEYKSMFDLWRGNVLLLSRSAADETPADPVAELMEAAASIGLTLRFTGSLPQTNERKLLLMLAAGEAMANARRHAGATELTVCSDETGVRFTNNGLPPAGPVAEGGGLSTVRAAAEKLGADMRIQTEKGFALIIEY